MIINHSVSELNSERNSNAHLSFRPQLNMDFNENKLKEKEVSESIEDLESF
jgi:hypothetical protein